MVRPLTRRRVLTGGVSFFIAGAAIAEPSRTRRVALVISSGGYRAAIIELFGGTLRTLGYEEGKNLIIDFREANGRYDLLPDLVKELIALKPDVIVAEATPAIAAAQRATSTIPIVMSPATDPIGSGFVTSLAHPGGNITGVANMFGDLTAKTLDFLRLVFPNAKKIGVLTTSNPTHPGLFEVAKQAAAKIGISAERFIAPTDADLERAFAEMKAANCEVVYVIASPYPPVLGSITMKSGLPTVHQITFYVENGGLMGYGPDISAFYVQAAHYVDRILKGGNPAEMPVEQPTTFQFVVNLRTAKALGVTIPERVLLMADKVIE